MLVRNLRDEEKMLQRKWRIGCKTWPTKSDGVMSISQQLLIPAEDIHHSH